MKSFISIFVKYVVLLLLVCRIEAGVLNPAVSENMSKQQYINVLFLNGNLGQQLIVAAIANDLSEFTRVVFNFQFPDDYSFSQLAKLQKEAQILVRFNEVSNHFVTKRTYHGDAEREIAISEISPRVVLHEFGHALGLSHEHQHRDSYLRKDLDAEEICSAFGYVLDTQFDNCQHNILKRYDNSERMTTSYDPNSIMHYEIPSMFLETNEGTKKSEYFSLGDIKTLSIAYPNRLIGLTQREIKKKWKDFYVESKDFVLEHDYSGDDSRYVAKLKTRSESGKLVKLYEGVHYLDTDKDVKYVTVRYKDKQGHELVLYSYQTGNNVALGKHYVNSSRSKGHEAGKGNWTQMSHADPNYDVRFLYNDGKKSQDQKFMVHPNFIKTMHINPKSLGDFVSLVKVYSVVSDYTTYEYQPGDGLFYILHYFNKDSYVIEVKNRGRDFKNISYSGRGNCRVGRRSINSNPKVSDGECKSYIYTFVEKFKDHPIEIPEF